MTKDNGEIRKCFIIPPQSILILCVWAGKTVGGFVSFSSLFKRKCLQRLGLCCQRQGKSVRKRFNSQCSIFQVCVTGRILISAFTLNPAFAFIQDIKVALDLNVYDMKIYPQLNKRVDAILMIYRTKTFFRLVETPPVMGSLEQSLVPHSVKESRRLFLNPSRFWCD